ncbi:MAG: hypothetical protein R3D43_04945 [Tepidamorphaceae bacterium]
MPLNRNAFSPEETKQAQDLLRRIERALSGWTGSIAVTGGVRSGNGSTSATAPTGTMSAPSADRTLRQDLKNATRSSIPALSGTRRFFDVDLSSTTGEQDHFCGRAAITWDKAA